MGELSGIGRYERHGQGPPVVILSNPQADPAWWAQPFTSALASAGYEAISFAHAGPSWAPDGVVRDVATFIECAATGPSGCWAGPRARPSPRRPPCCARTW